MRKSMLLLSLGGCALVATAVLAADGETPTTTKKKDDGPGMTFNQKMTSFFGLIDQGSTTPPPTPPGMPPMNSRGSVKLPHAQSGKPVPSNNMAGPTVSRGAATSVARDPSLPQPPQPMRIVDGSSDKSAASPNASLSAASEEPRTLPQGGAAAAKLAAQPRTSIVGASKMPLFSSAPQAATQLGGANTVVKSAVGGTSGWTAGGGMTAAGNSNPISPVAAPGGVSRPSVGTVPTMKPFVSSRRKPTTSDSTTTPNTASAEPQSPALIPVPMAAPAQKPNPAPSSSVATEPFVPAMPSFTHESAAPAPPIVASSQAPGVLSPATAAKSQPTPSRAVVESTIGNAPVASPTRADVLVSHTNPELTVETIGPRRIALGRESVYRVLVRNRGNIDARDVVVSVQVPDHAEVAGVRGTAGSSTSADEISTAAPIEWRIDTVPARSQEELTIGLVPRRSESFELGVRLSSSTPVSRAIVEVEEPRLALAIAGPSDVAFGEQRLFKLTVSNPGTGTAENVVLHLMPLSTGDGEPVRHAVGTLKPGESSVVEVELTARQAGALRIRSEALAEGNLRAEAVAEVTVRRAVLDVAVTAPRLLFAGVPGTYEFRIRNTGDEAARNVRVSVDLPGGAKLLSTSPTARGDLKSNQLTWSFDHIGPGSELVCTLKCAWEQGGKQQLTLVTAADGDLRKTTVAVTEVQAVADLALDVVDTAGPIPVGRPVTYEIHVKNRGLKSAENVDIVAYFSEGIEPERAEGQAFEIQPGMVIFRPLTTVGPGQEKVLKVTARAQTSGNHRLRVEMQSSSPQTQLSHEDATFFYSDEAVDPTQGMPGSFKPQSSSPIRPTAGGNPAGAKQPVINAGTSTYRVNTIR